MACFVSLSFAIPLCSFRNPLKGRCPRKLAFCRFPVLASATTKTATYHLPNCSSTKGMFSVNFQEYPNLTTLSKYFDEIVSCSLKVSYCACTVLIGYWVGPDIDDGWGFVEAFIVRSS